MYVSWLHSQTWVLQRDKILRNADEEFQQVPHENCLIIFLISVQERFFYVHVKTFL